MKTTRQHADRILKNYNNFLKLANEQREGNFNKKARELLTEIDNTVKSMDTVSKAIINNWYCQQNKRKSRAEMCKSLKLSISEYQEKMTSALIYFAETFLNGAILLL